MILFNQRPADSVYEKRKAIAFLIRDLVVVNVVDSSVSFDIRIILAQWNEIYRSTRQRIYNKLSSFVFRKTDLLLHSSAT